MQFKGKIGVLIVALFIAGISLSFLWFPNLTGHAVSTIDVGTGANYVDGYIMDDPAYAESPLPIGYDLTNSFRSYIDFDTSSLVGGTINSVTLKLKVKTAVPVGMPTVDIYILSATAASMVGSAPQTLYDGCGGEGLSPGILVKGEYTGFAGKTDGQEVSILLDAPAAANLESQLLADNPFFTVCLKSHDESTNANFQIYSSESAGNEPVLEVDSDGGIVADTDAPTTTATLTSPAGGEAYSAGSWTGENVGVTLACDDGAGEGCGDTTYCTDTSNSCTPDTTYSEMVIIPTEGTSYIRYHSVDLAVPPNTEAVKSDQIKIDTTAPVSATVSAVSPSTGETAYTFGAPTKEDVGVTISACDDGTGSGECTYTYCVDDANTCEPNTAYSGVVTISDAGTSYFRYKAMDSLSNEQATASSNIVIIDQTAPVVTITSPTTGTYSSNSYNVDIGINEAGLCAYSLDAGVSSSSLTANGGNTAFTGTVSSVANGNYVLTALCSDSAGNRNDASTVSFTVNVVAETPSDGGGGGGGGGSSCTVEDWDCGEWSSCIGGEETRSCTSNCNTVKTERRDCSINETCTNQCSAAGKSCDGNSVVTCELVGECYKITSIDSCDSGESCNNGVCELDKKEDQRDDNPVIEAISDRVVAVVGGLTNLPRPSDIIPHGDIPPAVVDTAVTTTGVAAVGGIGWWIWILIAGSSLPFFMAKLRHYSVSVFDSHNQLQIFSKDKLDKGRLLIFLSSFEKLYGEKLVFASKSDEVVQYIVSRGFVEVRLDGMFIMTGHFTRARDAGKFEGALKRIAQKPGTKVVVFSVVEKASIFGAWRAWRRERRSKKQLKKVVR